jgi:hypothetical protein
LKLLQVRNRRFRKLQQLQASEEYFSDENMQARDFHLYHQFVGQYLSADEVDEREARKADEMYVRL